jgi:pseudouridine-5'-phosphate glycosidase
MPYPQNVETAKAVEDIIRQQGAIPATIAILDGKVHIGKKKKKVYAWKKKKHIVTNIFCLGLTDQTLEYLGKVGPKAQKASRRDLPVVLAQVKCIYSQSVFCYTRILTARK